MFKKVDVPLLGIVENMSYFIAPDTGKRYDIFGHGGARREAERLGVTFLGEVPLEMGIRETSDSGKPITATAPDSPNAEEARRAVSKHAECACHRYLPRGGASFETTCCASLLRKLEIEGCTTAFQGARRFLRER
jgi:hypothetical protein